MARARAAAGAVVVAAALAACQSAGETLAEQAIEAGAGDADVEVDVDDEGEGRITIEQDDGTQTIEVGGGELPDGLTVALPDGFEVAGSTTLEQGEERIASVNLRYPGGDFDGLVAHFDDELGGTPDLTRSESTSGGDRQVLWIRPDPALQVQVIQADGDEAVNVFVVESLG